MFPDYSTRRGNRLFQMKEKTKEVAMQLGVVIGDYPFFMAKRASEILFSDRSQFLKACAVYFDNREHFETVVYAYRHSSIEEYARSNGGALALTNALRSQILPKCAVDAINAGILKSFEPPPPPPPKVRKEPRKTFIYIMINRRNGLYKIGNSKEPNARESTLQSEEPEIELVTFWPGHTGDEKELHEKFAGVRVRGEWFRLSAEDVEELKGREVVA